jgi:hypothetical protein
MIKRPIVDNARFDKVWNEHVFNLRGAYAMNEEPAAERERSVADVA